MNTQSVTSKIKESVRQKTELEKEMWLNQRLARKTVGSMFGRGIGLVVAGVVGWIIFTTFDLFKFATDNVIFIGLPSLLLLLGAPLYGIYMIISSVSSSKRIVTCPYCGEKHLLFSKVRSYICTGCARVLRFLENNTREMIKVTCPLCGLEWATTIDAGNTNCFSCGQQVYVAEGQVERLPHTQTCANCKTPLRESQYFCPKCGMLHAQPPEAEPYEFNMYTESISVGSTSDGMDVISLMANSGLGFVVRTTWMLQQIRTTIEQNMVTQDQIAALSHNDRADHINKHTKFLQQMKKGIGDLSEALTLESKLAPAILDTLNNLRASVAFVLNNAVDWKSGYFGVVNFANLKEWMAYWADYSKEYNGLLERLQSMADSKPDAWPTPFITLTVTEKITVENGVIDRLAIENRGELQTWVNQQLPSFPLPRLRLSDSALVLLNKTYDEARQETAK